MWHIQISVAGIPVTSWSNYNHCGMWVWSVHEINWKGLKKAAPYVIPLGHTNQIGRKSCQMSVIKIHLRNPTTSSTGAYVRSAAIIWVVGIFLNHG